MKILVNLIYYEQGKPNYLDQIIKEYNSYPYEVDIFIHSNINNIRNINYSNYNNGKIVIKKYNLFWRYLIFKNKGYYLTWAPRNFIKANIDKYDVFIQTDDDILIPVNAFNYWLEEKDHLFARQIIPGFILLEVDEDGNEFAMGYNKQELDQFIQIENNEYLVNNNHRYMASWIYDKSMMEYWIDSGYFDIRKITKVEDLKSNILDLLNIKSLKFRYLLYNWRNNSGNGIRENSAYGMNSPNINLIKQVVFKLENKKFCQQNKIYHLDVHYSKEDHEIGQTKLNDIYNN